MKPLIQIQNLTIKYNDNIVLEDFSYDFYEGIYAVTGPSGIGKTSLAHAVAGIIPYTGKIISVPGLRQSVVFQDNRLLEGLSVIKNLCIPSGCTKEQAIKAINDTGLAGSHDTPVYRLSGGMKRRVAILRAILTPSDVIIMDEPFTGLDKEIKMRVMQYIKENTSGKIMIMITHDMSEAEYFDSEILRLT